MEIDRLLRIREAILDFYSLHEQDSTPELFRVWLKTLDRAQRKQNQALGFALGRQLISFQSYVLERKGYYICDFLASALSPEDYEYFLHISAPLAKPEPLPC